MFDIGWSELTLIGVVALIVVGPKDLPKLFHALGQFTAKARSMARDFQRAMEQAAREAGAEDIAKDLKSLTSMRNMGLDALDSASKKIGSWEATKRAATSSTTPEDEAAADLADLPPAAAPAPEMGPATSELAAQVRANAAAAEAKAAELAAARTAAADPAPAARKPRAPRKPKAEAAPAAEAAAAPAAKRTRTPKAAPPEGAAPAPKRTRSPKAEPAPAAEGEAAAAPKKRTRASTKKSDA